MTDAKPQGRPRPKYPLPQQCAAQLAGYALDQDYALIFSAFGTGGPWPKNTPASSAGLSDTKAILTSVNQPTDKEADIARFTAQFSVVPASWDDFRTVAYAFPGFPGILGQGSRNPFTDKVSCRLHYDYYVLDPANIISTVADGTPSTATSLLDSGGTAVKVVYKLGDIPLVSKSNFVVAKDGTPDYSNRTQSLIVSGGANIDGTDWWQTQPTKTVYQSWISQASSLGWLGIVWPGNNNNINDGSAGAGHAYTQLVAEDSNLEPYAGNIVARVTMYVLAK